MIENHYGYGVRNDERPFAHLIPPGGYWKSLPLADQLTYWNGKLPTGSTNGLRRRRWTDPSGTITTTPMQKLSCQLHPGERKGVAPAFKPLLCALPKLPDSGFTSMELFAGGGLMRLGVEHAGVRTVWANDFKKSACIAHEHNFGTGSIQLGDITKIPISMLPDTDLVIGGPPCQDYSEANREGGGEDGERGRLIWNYLEIIEVKGPKAFLFENVPGLVQKKNRHTFDALLEAFRKVGYNVAWKLVNAWDYGVAEKRERVIIVGIREDFGITYQFPRSEFELTGYRCTLHDAIGDLPDLGPAPRRFTVRECLRIQSVPDSYVLPENISLAAMHEIVGNGVACRVAYHLTKALVEQLQPLI